MTNAMRVVPEVHTSRKGFPLVPLASDFDRATKDGLRLLRDHTDALNRKESRVLDDLHRDRGLAMVRHALVIARYRASCPAAATGLLENWRGFVLAGHVVNCPVMDAFRMETESNGTANLAQFDYEISPTEANRARAIEALNRQLAETRRALDALHGVRR